MAEPRYGKKYAQNFFVGAGIVRRLLNRTDIEPGDTVLEIGTGPGWTTLELARRVARVIAYEIDPVQAGRAARRTARTERVRIVTGDFLEASPLGAPADFKVFANLPFNRTTAIVKRLLLGDRAPASAWLVLEAGAARRLTACGSSSVIACLVAARYRARQVAWISRHEFRPAPRVDACFAGFVKREAEFMQQAELRRYEAHLRRIFQGSHRALYRNLRPRPGWKTWCALAARLGIDPGARPSQLTTDQHRRLFDHFDA